MLGINLFALVAPSFFSILAVSELPEVVPTPAPFPIGKKTTKLTTTTEPTTTTTSTTEAPTTVNEHRSAHRIHSYFIYSIENYPFKAKTTTTTEPVDPTTTTTTTTTTAEPTTTSTSTTTAEPTTTSTSTSTTTTTTTEAVITTPAPAPPTPKPEPVQWYVATSFRHTTKSAQHGISLILFVCLLSPLNIGT